MLARMAQWAFAFGGWSGDGEENEQGLGGLAGSLLMVVLAPIAATLIQLALSRAREYQAGADGTKTAGDPDAPADALKKLHPGGHLWPGETNPALSPLFIVNPFTDGIPGLPSTHPPIRDRIARPRRTARLRPRAFLVA